MIKSIKMKRVANSKYATQIAKYKRILDCHAVIGWNDSFSASKAFTNEKGCIEDDHEIPPRPFIYPAIVEKSKQGVTNDFISSVRLGRIKKAFQKEGDTVRDLIVDKINKLQRPTLARRTIRARKKAGPSFYVAGLNKPLISTGDMRDSVEVTVIGGES